MAHRETELPRDRELDEDDGALAAAGDAFRRAARVVAHGLGTPWAFFAACAVVVVWAVSGPALGFSTTWQLVINTGTTIVTFLMVFLIQNTQNRDSEAMHLKIDELLRATAEAHTDYVDLEDLSENQLKRLHARFKEMGLQSVGAGESGAMSGNGSRQS